MILYIILLIILIAVAVFFGVKISEGIYHPTLLVFFWVIYIATLLTVGNAVSTVFFYNVLRTKRGIPGDQGRVGDKGDSGIGGVCDITCNTKACTFAITNAINDAYNSLVKSSNKSSDKTDKFDKTKATIKNREVMDNIKIICNSDAYKQVSKFKDTNTVNNYIIKIYVDWLKLLFESDKTDDKHIIIEYLETDGLEERPDLNGFDELEKYDVYYWGRDRVFHPRVVEYCGDPDINKKMQEHYPPIIKGIRTNIYQPLLTRYRFGRKRRFDTRHTDWLSIYRVSPYTFEGVVYYPLGDYCNHAPNISNKNKFVETLNDENKRSRIDFKNNEFANSPVDATILVNANNQYVRPPQDWQYIWQATKSDRNINMTVWKPKDFYDNTLNKWFRGCGTFTLFDKGMKNPREVYGYNTPEKQPIRLVAEELLIKIETGNLKYAWNDQESGQVRDVTYWTTNDQDYRNNINLPLTTNSYNKPSKLTFYKLNLDKFKELKVGSIKMNNELISNSAYGFGVLGADREPKYSVFSFLDIPVQVILTNSGNADKIFIRHSGLNQINSYMIQKVNIGEDELKTTFGVKSNTYNVSQYQKYNPNDENQIWLIVCVDDNNMISKDCKSKKYLIKSQSTDLYLTSMIDQSTTNNFIYTVKQLPSSTSKDYNSLIQQFLWIKPTSATGNHLVTEKKTK